MKMLGPVIGALVTAAIGAGVWAAIAYYADYEIGWIAWGIGGLVGFGVIVGARATDFSDGGVLTGGLAVAMAVLSILAGKYLAVSFMVDKEAGIAIENVTEMLQDDELVISYLADDLIGDGHPSVRDTGYARGVNPEKAGGPSDYEPAVWAAAKTQWNDMDAEEQEAYRQSLIDAEIVQIDVIKEEVRGMGFKESFSGFDIIFFVLAIITAYKIGSGVEE